MEAQSVQSCLSLKAAHPDLRAGLAGSLDGGHTLWDGEEEEEGSGQGEMLSRTEWSSLVPPTHPWFS